MILFKPYSDLSHKKIDGVWNYWITVTVFTNVPLVGAIGLFETFSNSPKDGFLEVKLGATLQTATATWASEHVFSYTSRILLGQVQFSSGITALKVCLVKNADGGNLGTTIVHQDDAEEDGMPVNGLELEKFLPPK
jgi:hypothetical protein